MIIKKTWHVKNKMRERGGERERGERGGGERKRCIYRERMSELG